MKLCYLKELKTEVPVLNGSGSLETVGAQPLKCGINRWETAYHELNFLQFSPIIHLAGLNISNERIGMPLIQ